MNVHAIYAEHAAHTEHTTHAQHIIFNYGTVVIVTPTDSRMCVFTQTYVDDWPLERLESPDDFIAHLTENVTEFNSVLQKYEPSIVYAAYAELINAGYPAADDSSTRYAEQIAPNTYIVRYPFIDYKCFNVLEHADADTAVILGGEYRRLDYMFPKIRAVYAQHT